MEFVWSIVYVGGMMLTARYVALRIQDDIDVQNFEITRKNKDLPKKERQKLTSWDAGDAVLLIFATGFWFVFAAIWAGKMLLFPRGFKSRFAREQENLAKTQEAEARAAQAEEELRKMQDEVLRFTPRTAASDPAFAGSPSFDFPSSLCTMPIQSSVPGMLRNCGEPSVPFAHHCHEHLINARESA